VLVASPDPERLAMAVNQARAAAAGSASTRARIEAPSTDAGVALEQAAEDEAAAAEQADAEREGRKG
jgi:hypothetical protein